MLIRSTYNTNFKRYKHHAVIDDVLSMADICLKLWKMSHPGLICAVSELIFVHDKSVYAFVNDDFFESIVIKLKYGEEEKEIEIKNAQNYIDELNDAIAIWLRESKRIRVSPKKTNV